MRNCICVASAALLTAALTTGAQAATAIVDGLGGPLLVHGKTIEGVFGSGTPEWTNAALKTVHTELQNDGITTNRVVTFVLANTDHGVTWMALVDDPHSTNSGNPKPSSLGMASTAPITGVKFVNSHTNDIQNEFDHGNGLQTASGFFNWDADRQGRGFAWASLADGDFVSFNFTRQQDTHPGLRNDNRTFQFVSWNGTNWEVVATRGFSSIGQFAFSFTIIPLPAPVLLGLAGLGMVGLMRRRMMKRA